jgi:hypothetical protein
MGYTRLIEALALILLCCEPAAGKGEVLEELGGGYTIPFTHGASKHPNLTDACLDKFIRRLAIFKKLKPLLTSAFCLYRFVRPQNT